MREAKICSLERGATAYGATGHSPMREVSAVLVVGGGTGRYQMPNVYGGGLGCELVVHMWSTSGSNAQAMLDIDGIYNANNTPASMLTMTTPLRGAVVQAATSTAVPMGPLVTQATEYAQLVVLAGSVWISYQWARIVPDPESNAVQTAAAATLSLHKPGCDGGQDCKCRKGRIGA